MRVNATGIVACDTLGNDIRGVYLDRYELWIEARTNKQA